MSQTAVAALVEAIKTKEQIREVWALLRARYRLLDWEAATKAAAQFKIGDRVTFTGRRRSQHGEVRGWGQKNAIVVAGDGRRWRVHPSRMRKVA